MKIHPCDSFDSLVPWDPCADWRSRAACRGENLSAFYPPAGQSPRRALAICEHCPVIDCCLDAALAEEAALGPTIAINLGVRGGLTARQRAALTRQENAR